MYQTMAKYIENKNILVMLEKHWLQIQPQISEWLEFNQINVRVLPIPPNFESVAVRFPSEEYLLTFKIRWSAKLKTHD